MTPGLIYIVEGSDDGKEWNRYVLGERFNHRVIRIAHRFETDSTATIVYRVRIEGTDKWGEATPEKPDFLATVPVTPDPAPPAEQHDFTDRYCVITHTRVCKLCGAFGNREPCVPNEHWRAERDGYLSNFQEDSSDRESPKPDRLARDDWHRKSQALVGGLLHKRGWLL